MSLSTELAYRSAADLAALVRRRELSPVELLDAVAERIERRNPALNAFCFLALDEARDRARAAERAVLAGEPLGLLHGVPTAIKDLLDSKPGWPTTFGGIRALRGNIVSYACVWCERMERAGAVVVGKTNSCVIGFRGITDNPLFGPTSNPFDLTRNAGGSSGGAAAAVADGLVPIAEGTDGGGSVRIPAAWCGTYGYKPSFGRTPFVNPTNPFIGLTPYISEGFLTRTVRDAAIGLQVLSGYDSRDPLSIPTTEDFLGTGDRSIAGMRIAYSPDFGTFPVEPSVARLAAEGVNALTEAGAQVEVVDVDLRHDQRELSDLWCRMMQPITIECLERLKTQGFDLLSDHRDDLPDALVEWVDRGYRASVTSLLNDQRMRGDVYRAIQGVLDDYDILATPTVACLAVDNATDGNTLGPSRVNGVEVDPLIGWTLTYPVNFTGHPAASVPAGLADGRHPVGLQLIGRRYADDSVLAVSHALERVRPWAATYRRVAVNEAIRPVA